MSPHSKHVKSSPFSITFCDHIFFFFLRSGLTLNDAKSDQRLILKGAKKFSRKVWAHKAMYCAQKEFPYMYWFPPIIYEYEYKYLYSHWIGLRGKKKKTLPMSRLICMKKECIF